MNYFFRKYFLQTLYLSHAAEIFSTLLGRNFKKGSLIYSNLSPREKCASMDDSDCSFFTSKCTRLRINWHLHLLKVHRKPGNKHHCSKTMLCINLHIDGALYTKTNRTLLPICNIFSKFKIVYLLVLVYLFVLIVLYNIHFLVVSLYNLASSGQGPENKESLL